MITVAARDKDGIAMLFRVPDEGDMTYQDAITLVRSEHPDARVFLASVGGCGNE